MKRTRLLRMVRNIATALLFVTIIFATGMYRQPGAWLIIDSLIAVIPLTIGTTIKLIQKDKENSEE